MKYVILFCDVSMVICYDTVLVSDSDSEFIFFFSTKRFYQIFWQLEYLENRIVFWLLIYVIWL